jgi:hypothetical protein
MEDYEHYRRLLAQEHLQELGRALGREAERQGLTEEALIEEMEEDRRAVLDDRAAALRNSSAFEPSQG